MLYIMNLPVRRIVAGLEVQDGVVVDAPPVARWTIGKTVDQVQRWAEGKGGSVTGYEDAGD